MGMTARALATLKPGEWLTEAGNRNEGALRAKAAHTVRACIPGTGAPLAAMTISP
jgi:hypothetical protein